MPLPVKFTTDTVVHDDGTAHEREIIMTTHPDGTESARLATDRDRAVHEEAFADFVDPEETPTYEALLAEWRKTHPQRPPAARIVAARQDEAKRVDAAASAPVDPALAASRQAALAEAERVAAAKRAEGKA